MSSSGYPVFEELSDSPRVVFATGDHQMVRRFKVAWADLNNFVHYISTGGTGDSPTAYPAFANARVREVSAEPFGGQDVPPDQQVILNPLTAVNTYSEGTRRGALVTVTYGLLPYDREWPATMPRPEIPEGTYLRISTRMSGQFLTFPGRSGTWSGDTLEASVYSQIPSSSGATPSSSGTPGTYRSTENAILIPTKDIRIEWYGLTEPLTSRLDLYIGRVNSAPILGCPPSTLLYEGWELEEDFKIDPLHPFAWKVVLLFRQRIKSLGYDTDGDPVWVTWNHDYRPSKDGSSGGWSYVLLSSGQPRYPLGDLSEVFNTTP